MCECRCHYFLSQTKKVLKAKKLAWSSSTLISMQKHAMHVYPTKNGLVLCFCEIILIGGLSFYDVL